MSWFSYPHKSFRLLEKEESSSVKNFQDEKHEVCLSKLKILNLDLVGKHKRSKLSTGVDSKPDRRLWTVLNSNKSAKNNKTPNITENNKGATNNTSINGLLSKRFFHKKNFQQTFQIVPIITQLLTLTT